MSAKHSLPPPSPASSSDDESEEIVAVDAGVEEDEVYSSSEEISKSTPKKKPDHKPSSKSKSDAGRKPAAPTRYDGAKSFPKPAASEYSKKKKRKLGPSGGDVEERRLGCVVPLWSEEDEVAILNGIKVYRKEKGSDPFNDLTAFLDFLQGSLSVVVSKRQLGDKARRLKKKYTNEAALNGGVFVKPRDLRLFEISKEIWGGEDTDASARKSNKKQETAEDAGVSGSGRRSKRLVEEKQSEKSDKGGSKGRKEIVLSGNEEVEKNKERKEIGMRENGDVEIEEAVRMKGDSDLESSYPNFHAALMDFLTGHGPVDGRNLVKQNLGLAEERARVVEPQLNAFYVEEMKMRAEKIRLRKLVADAGVEIAGKGSQ